MKFKIPFLLLLLLIFSTFVVKAQDPNERGFLPHYYNQAIHFGFILGVNRANFMIDPAENFEKFDSLKRVESNPKMGFNLGIVADLRLHKYLTLRFVPNLCFAERTLSYSFLNYDSTTITRKKTIESTFINFPLNLKLRSKRVHNFGAYIIAGGAYNLDLASKKNSPPSDNPNLNEQVIKLKRDDFSYEVGTGIELYLEYFKFGIEAKLSMGTNDLLIKENTIFSNAINKLNSKVFLISLTFEG